MVAPLPLPPGASVSSEDMSLLLIFGGALALLMLAVRTALEAGDQARLRRHARLLFVAVPLWIGSWAALPSLMGPGDQATVNVRAATPAPLAFQGR